MAAGTPSTRWQKGQSGNPGGRPKVIGDLQEQARQWAPEALEALRAVATSKDAPPSARVSAAVALLDRGYGKPAQSIDAKVSNEPSTAQLHLQALKELAAQQQNLQRQIQAYNQEFMAIRKDMEDLKTLVSQQQGQARKLEATLNKVGELEKRVAELEAARASK